MVFSTGIPFLVIMVCINSAPIYAADNKHPEIERLEDLTRGIRDIYLDTPERMLYSTRRMRLHQGFRQILAGDWQNGRAQLMSILLEAGLSSYQRRAILFELALAEEKNGAYSLAISRLRHILYSNSPGYSVAAFERLLHIAETVKQSIFQPHDFEAFQRNYSDNHDHQTWLVYRYARHLARNGMPIDHLQPYIPKASKYYLRFVYLQAVAFLYAEKRDVALSLFEFIITNSVTNDSDQYVVDLARLAVARLHYEQNEHELAIAQYLLIPQESQLFTQAFYELGWLSFETGRMKMANDAFTTLAQLDLKGVFGLKARLMQGMVLINEKHYEDAKAHYATIRSSYKQRLQSLDYAISKIPELGRLAQDCEYRTIAQQDPFLRPIVENSEVDQVYHIWKAVEKIATNIVASQKMRDYLDAIVQEKTDFKPFAIYDSGITRTNALLQELNIFAQKIGIKEVLLHHSYPLVTSSEFVVTTEQQTCCDNPKDRIIRLQGRLHGLLLELKQRKQSMKQAYMDELQKVQRDVQQSQLQYSVVVKELQQVQQKAVSHAALEEQKRFQRLIIETETGELEAIWRQKIQAADKLYDTLNKRRDAVQNMRHEIDDIWQVIVNEQ